MLEPYQEMNRELKLRELEKFAQGYKERRVEYKKSVGKMKACSCSITTSKVSEHLLSILHMPSLISFVLQLKFCIQSA